MIAFHGDGAIQGKYPERFLAAPKVGADLRLVFDRFQHWILTEEHPDRGEHCARMGALIARRLAGDEPTSEQWDRDARDARAARDASISRMADALIKFMAEAPVAAEASR